jgi:hypothetical protein
MSLSPQDYREIFKCNKESIDEWHKKGLELRKQELAKKGIITQENKKDNFHGDCDHPNTMENGSATILYIIIMLGGTIFNDRLLIWILATIIFWKFITRHKK